MKKLLKAYKFTEIEQYYDMIWMSIVNGHNPQAQRQFLAMPKLNRKEFVILFQETWSFSSEYKWCTTFFIELI
jgi:hypothetical protein